MDKNSSCVTVDYDSTADHYHISYDLEKIRPGLAVVEAIAAVEGIDVLAIEPFGTTIDLEALDSVLQSGTCQSDPTVTLRTHGYEVTLYGSERLVLQRLDSEPVDSATTD